MSEVSKTWVIAKAKINQGKFNPAGFFYTETHVRKGKSYRWVRGVTNAQRKTKSEAVFIRDELMNLHRLGQWIGVEEIVLCNITIGVEEIVLFNIADALFGECGR